MVSDAEERGILFQRKPSQRQVFPYGTIIISVSATVIGDARKALMDKYECIACGYIYDPAQGDPDNGIPAGTPFEKLPDDWVCPVCGVGKDQFEKVD